MFDQVNPNRKIWEALSPYDYSMECHEWEFDNPERVCHPFDEKPGKIIGRSTDSIPKTPKTMPLPAGEKCNRIRLKDNPADQGSATTADIDDLLEMIQKARTRNTGGRR